MQRRPYNLKQKEPTLICNNPNCNNISSKLYIVEEKIIEALKIWLNGYNVNYSELESRKTEFPVIKTKVILKQLEEKLLSEKINLIRYMNCLKKIHTISKNFLSVRHL